MKVFRIHVNKIVCYERNSFQINTSFENIPSRNCGYDNTNTIIDIYNLMNGHKKGVQVYLFHVR